MKKIYNCSNLLYIWLLIFVFLVSCNHQPKNTDKQTTISKSEKLVIANKYLVEKDAETVKSYIQHQKWEMHSTPTGLWYMIYQKGTGVSITKKGIVTYNYKISLLDGTLCYSSDETGAKSFKVSEGGVEPGLEESVLLLKVGDKARFIMFPHLAYGLMGDQKKIPPRSILLYDIEIINFTR